MKHAFTFLLLISSVAFGQRASKSGFDSIYRRTVAENMKLGITNIDSTQTPKNESHLAPVVGREYDVSARTGILPITFSRLEEDNGSYSIGNAITMGGGISWIWGKATYKDSKTIRIDPDLFLGFGIEAGPRVNDQSKLDFALGISGYFGFEKVGLAIGRDFINGIYFIGIATNIDLSSLNIMNTTITSISDIVTPVQ